jgi:hydrogenase maturation protein HypF
VAHIAAVLGEHGVTDRVIGVAFDGTGYGTDGHVWGAEFFVADLWTASGGQLRYAPMLPAATWPPAARGAACSGTRRLAAATRPGTSRGVRGRSRRSARWRSRQIARRLNAPLASSMGRLFDAAAAVLGVRHESAYEGQAPMELEALAGDAAGRPAAVPGHAEDGRWQLEPLPLLAAIEERRARGGAPGRPRRAVPRVGRSGTAALVDRIAASSGVRTVALGGGVFQNARLLARWPPRIERGARGPGAAGLGPNDGAISYGQAALAAATLQREEEG